MTHGAQISQGVTVVVKGTQSLTVSYTVTQEVETFGLTMSFLSSFLLLVVVVVVLIFVGFEVALVVVVVLFVVVLVVFFLLLAGVKLPASTTSIAIATNTNINTAN